MQISSISPSVYIIILNWNGYEDTLECLQSVSKINFINYKIIIVDNGSDTDEIDKLVIDFPQVKLIKSKDNLGFSGGNNLALDYSIKAGCDFVLLLNNDTIVEPDFLNNLIDNFLKDDKVGIAVPKINYYSNPKIVWYAGGYFSKLKGTGFSIGNLAPKEKYNENKYVTFATGCCLLIDINVLKETGLMDENYFLYLEDTDLCLRVLNAKYKILYVGSALIYHKINAASSKSNSNMPLYYTTRNRLYLTKKLFLEYLPILKFYIGVSMMIKFVYWIIKGETNKLKVVRKAFSDFKRNKFGKSEDF